MSGSSKRSDRRTEASKKAALILSVALATLLALSAVVAASGGGSLLGAQGRVLGPVVSSDHPSSTSPIVTAPEIISHGSASRPARGSAPSASPSLTVTPTSGYVGSALTFKGSGFAGSSTLAVTWSLGTACTAKTSSSGSFSCKYTLGQTDVGAHSFTATDAAGNSASASFTVVPRLTVGPTSGPAGTTVEFQGTGFAAYYGSSFSVTWGAGLVTACSGYINGYGTFYCSYTIPAGTATGSYTFTGSDNYPHTATTTFKVTYTPTLTVSPASGIVGTTVTFNGTGFAKSSVLTIGWSEGTACNGTTSAKGDFVCSFSVPESTVGAHIFSAEDASSGTATASFTTVPALTVSPSSGPAGTTVEFQGTGFAAYYGSSFSVSWYSGLVTACSGYINGYGSFYCSYTIPAGTATGSYNFTGSDNIPHTAMAVFRVTYTPTLTVFPTKGHVGAPLTFNGTSFAANSNVTVSWAGGTACTATTGAKGSFSCSYTMAETSYGAQLFTATDLNSAMATATYSVVPELTVSPTSGPAGTAVTFQGTGFQTYYGASYSVSWFSGLATACSGYLNGYGSFSCSYTIPSGIPAAVYNFTASDNYPHTAVTTFAVTPTLSLSPSSGLVGTSITFNGSSFAKSSSVTVSWSAGTACTATTDASGGFSCSYAVPAGTAGGTHKFTATDASGDSASATFSSPPRLTVSVASAPTTSSITFDGKGFSASSAITVNWTGGIACTATSTGGGAFNCTFKVPAASAGTYVFTAEDANFNVATTTFTIVAHLSSTPTSGTVGSSVTFSGTGFTASSPVWVNWTNGVACSSATGKTGSFACSFTVTAAPGQMYTFTATDGGARRAAATFTLEAAVTVSPGSVAPGATVTFNGTGYAGTSAITVNWTSGTACTATTNAVGNFSCTFTVPKGTSSGSYTFTATDASSDQATVKLTVT